MMGRYKGENKGRTAHGSNCFFLATLHFVAGVTMSRGLGLHVVLPALGLVDAGCEHLEHITERRMRNEGVLWPKRDVKKRF